VLSQLLLDSWYSRGVVFHCAVAQKGLERPAATFHRLPAYLPYSACPSLCDTRPPPTGVERRVNLSSIRAPRMGTRDRAPEPWAVEAKEFLRCVAVCLFQLSIFWGCPVV